MEQDQHPLALRSGRLSRPRLEGRGERRAKRSSGRGASTGIVCYSPRVTLVDYYALGFAGLGAWGAFTLRAMMRAERPWSARRWYGLGVNFVFATSCIAAAFALYGRFFAGWMLLPFGASYAGMIPMPCYFALVNRIAWVHAARNLLFALVSALSLALGCGLLPLSLFGL
jgi:hypothetical protein